MSKLERVKALWPEWIIGDMIGEGSFGAVYEMRRDMFGAQEQAALKVLSIPQKQSDVDELRNDGYRDESIRERFDIHLKEIAREYRTMAELKGHTNIVYSDDLRFLPNENGIGGDISIKMELLTSLPNHLSGQILLEDQTVIKIGMDICSALTVCRANQIIHRDIKPQNIFVSKDGNYKLGDFGIARATEGTSSGTRTGTYKYMAPEVYNNEPYGAAVDIYSLGMVLYWLLNERRGPFLPLPPETATFSQEEKGNAQRFSGKKLPPPAHGSKELQAVVLKACAFNPKDRYATPEDMKKSLAFSAENTPNDNTIGPKILPPFKQAPKTKKPLWIALGCAAAAVLVAAVSIMISMVKPLGEKDPVEPAAQEQLSAPQEIKDWKTLFEEQITGYRDTQQPPYDDVLYSYFLYDLTGDDVPELFLYQDDGYSIFQYDNGELVSMGEITAPDSVCPLDRSDSLVAVYTKDRQESLHKISHHQGTVYNSPLMSQVSIESFETLSGRYLSSEGYLLFEAMEIHYIDDLTGLEWKENPKTSNHLVLQAAFDVLPQTQEEPLSQEDDDTPVQEPDAAPSPEPTNAIPTAMTDGYWYRFSEQSPVTSEYQFLYDGTVQIRDRNLLESKYDGYTDQLHPGVDIYAMETKTYTVDEAKKIVTIAGSDWNMVFDQGRVTSYYMDASLGQICHIYLRYYPSVPTLEQLKEDYTQFQEEWNSQEFREGEYILPDSATRYLTEEDLQGLYHLELSLARNEIYARHGVKFSMEEISIYFHNRSWYEEAMTWDKFDPSMLNAYESYNVALIVDYEATHFGGSYY